MWQFHGHSPGMGKVRTKPSKAEHPDLGCRFGSLYREGEGKDAENSLGMPLMGLRSLRERVCDAPAVGAAVMLL